MARKSSKTNSTVSVTYQYLGKVIEIERTLVHNFFADQVRCALHDGESPPYIWDSKYFLAVHNLGDGQVSVWASRKYEDGTDQLFLGFTKRIKRNKRETGETIEEFAQNMGALAAGLLS